MCVRSSCHQDCVHRSQLWIAVLTAYVSCCCSRQEASRLFDGEDSLSSILYSCCHCFSKTEILLAAFLEEIMTWFDLASPPVSRDGVGKFMKAGNFQSVQSLVL